ncbi:hypothetical protein V4S84_14275, partial [Citrobacter freundii]|uniref:hypothetical protein n=1 Tax=Citrobacter freundii TaxID=546 RepID=UPI002F968159
YGGVNYHYLLEGFCLGGICMIILIFIKNIKKMNCLVLLICVGDNSETRHISSTSVLGDFLDKIFCGKILSFL